IFSLPSTAVGLWFPGGFPYQHLAYVEWFTPIVTGTSRSKYQVIQDFSFERRVSIIHVSLIRSSVHLFPKFGPQVPTSWSPSTVLEYATSFYVNALSD
ncbi:hypothetical protein BYT27DRAFT_7085388, partial [Phlegmacium glaucopus]